MSADLDKLLEIANPMASGKTPNPRIGINQSIIASIHSGVLSFNAIIERLTDRHRAKTPEPGLDLSKILSECYRARKLSRIKAVILVLPTFILFAAILESANEQYPSAPLITNLALPWVTATVVIFIFELICRSRTRQALQQTPSSEKTSEITPNILVSGGFSPFIGYGIDLDGWSFVVDTTKPTQKEGKAPQAVTFEELYSSISNAVRETLDTTELSDKLLVNGGDLRDFKVILPQPTAQPVVSLKPEQLQDFIGKNDPQARHYRCLRIPLWSETIFISVFFRFTRMGKNLYMECKFFLMPPIEKKYLKASCLSPKINVHEILGLGFTAAFRALYQWISPLFLIGKALIKFRDSILTTLVGSSEDKLKRQDPSYNYGFPFSLRESWIQADFYRYFQQLDKQMYVKLVQHTLLDSLVNLLQQKGINTENIIERQSTIINSGVIVNGGAINSDQFSVGKGARLFQQSKQGPTSKK